MRPAMPHARVPSVVMDIDSESDGQSDNETDSDSDSDGSSTTWRDDGAIDVSKLCALLLHQQNRDNVTNIIIDEIHVDIFLDNGTENSPTSILTMQAQVIMGIDGFVTETTSVDLTLLVDVLKTMAHTTILTKLSINVNRVMVMDSNTLLGRTNNTPKNIGNGDDPQRNLWWGGCCSPLLELVANTTVKSLAVEGRRGSMPLPLLDLLLQQAPHLEWLECFNVVLQGTQEDLDCLFHTLAQHSSLQKVQLFFLQFRFDTGVPGELQTPPRPTTTTTTTISSSGGAIMDGLLQALLKIPTLTTLGIWTSQSAALLPPQQHQQLQQRPPQELVSFHTLLQTCQSHSLTNLEVPGCLLTSSQLQQIAHQLLAPEVTTTTTTTTRSSLEHVHFKCNDLDGATCRALARLIRGNSTLQSIRLDILHPKAMVDSLRGGLLDLVTALAGNTTFHTLQLVGELHDNPPIDATILESLQDTLQTNFTLKELILLDCPLPPTLEFYLNLNRCGRAAMLQTADISNPIAWLRLLHYFHRDDGCDGYENDDNLDDDDNDGDDDDDDQDEDKDDNNTLHLLDLHFYYLSMNPSIIGTALFREEYSKRIHY